MIETASALDRRAGSAIRAASSSRRGAIAGRARQRRQVHAGRPPARFGEPLTASAAARRVGALPAPLARREERADVAQPGGAEQRVDQRMERRVAIGVARPGRVARRATSARRAASAVPRPADGRRSRRPTRARSPGRARRARRRASARTARIGGDVAGLGELAVGRIPGTAWTGTPAAARAPASSVTGRPQACDSSIAARSAPRRAACGVCAAATSSRSTGADDRARRGRASASRRPARPARPRARCRAAAAAAMRPTSSALTAGRAASWTRTSVASSWPAPVSAQRPGDDRVGTRLATGNDHARVVGGRQRARAKRSIASAGRRSRPGSRPGLGEQDVQRPSPGRTAPEVGPQLVAAHPPALSGGDEDGGERSGRRHRPESAQPASVAGLREDHPPGDRLEHAGDGDRRCRCSGSGGRPRPRSSCRRPGSRPPGRPPCPPG